MEALVINEQITIAAQYLSVNAVRSSGPGGQNVNKLATKAVLTFALDECPMLTDEIKERLRRLIGHRTNRDGQPMITSQQTRYRERNIEICREKLTDLIRRALIAPVERKKTKPSRVTKEKRLKLKHERSQKKELRRKIHED